MKKSHKIVETQVTADAVRLQLENGVHLHVCSNDGYIHLHFSGIGCQIPIKVFEQAPNQLNIEYPLPKD